MSIILSPIHNIQAEVTLPGSKSLTNRALLLASLSSGTTILHNLLNSDDTRYMREALTQLGVKFKFSKDFSSAKVQGVGGNFTSCSQELFLGNAGTAMRFLTACLCLNPAQNPPHNFIITGNQRMQERPIGHLVKALRQAGANIQYLKNSGFPPLQIQNSGLQGGNITINGSISSQFLSALLIIAPFFKQDTYIQIQDDLVSKPYINMTMQMMETFGVKIYWQTTNTNLQIYIPHGQDYLSPAEYFVEGDASTASYFLAVGALSGSVKVHGVGKNSLQGDSQFAEVLAQMGAKITYGENFIQAQKPSCGTLHGIDIDGNAIPDAIMTMAPLALFAQGKTTIRNVYNWKVKETDRLHALATELTKIGATVETGEDWITIYPLPASNFIQTPIHTYDDHRIAMCFSLLALGEKSVEIQDPNCVNKTCPSFWQLWQSLNT